MKKNTYKKVLSFVLALIMLVPFSPSIFATIDDNASVATPDSALGNTDSSGMQLDPATVPDIVGTDNAKAAGHVERLYVDESALNTVVFRNADGTKTVYYYDHPVKYIDENGTVKDISLDIESSSKVPGAYVSKDTRSQTVFSAKITDGIILTDTDLSLKLVPVFSSPSAEITPVVPGVSQMSTAVVGQASISPTATLSDNTVVYEYDAKTSYEYTLTYSGFKEDIVVSEYTGQTEYAFALYTNGLTLDTDSSGDFYLYDTDGNKKAGIGSIIIFTADWQNNAFGSMTAETVIPNEQYTLTIHIDADYLADEKTKYPIRIDPEYTVYYGDDSLESIDDITINTVDALSGTDGEISVGKWGSDGSVSRILMKFPALDLRNMHIIKEARIFIHDLMCQQEYLTLECYPFLGNTWSESNATWQSAGADSFDIETLLDSHDISYLEGINLETSQRYGFNITDAVNGWRDGSYEQDKGIIFKAAYSYETDPTHNYKTFASFERSNYKPSLQITYENYETYYLQNVATGKMLYNEVYNGSVSLSDELNDQSKWQLISDVDYHTVMSLDLRIPGAANAALDYPALSSAGVALSSSWSGYVGVEQYDAMYEEFWWGVDVSYENGDLICTLENCGGYYLSASNDTTVSLSSTVNDSSRWRMHPCSNPYSVEPGYADKINNTSLQKHMNCYAFVMGLYHYEDPSLDYSLDPGQVYGYDRITCESSSDTIDIFNCVNAALYGHYDTEYSIWDEVNQVGYIREDKKDDIAAIILQDVENDIKKIYGYSGGIRPTTYDAKMVGGWKKVALALSTEQLHMNFGNEKYFEYHWYVESSNGKWLHKPGLTEVQTLTLNPSERLDTIDRGVHDYFVGYYMIYSDSVLSKAILDSYSVSEYNDNAGDCIEHARALSIDNSQYVEGVFDYTGDIYNIVNPASPSALSDVDFYEFMVETTGTYSICVVQEGFSPITIRVYAEYYNGHELVVSDDEFDNGLSCETTIELEADTLYAISVSVLYSFDSGNYTLTITT